MESEEPTLPAVRCIAWLGLCACSKLRRRLPSVFGETRESDPWPRTVRPVGDLVHLLHSVACAIVGRVAHELVDALVRAKQTDDHVLRFLRGGRFDEELCVKTVLRGPVCRMETHQEVLACDIQLIFRHVRGIEA